MATSLKNLANATVARHAPPPPPLVLIAEDDADTRCLFRMVLETEGYVVIEATDGEETVSLAESAHPDLILMDGGLPRVDGFDATQRIRGFPNVGRVPIVFISGHAEPHFLALARDAGCDEYLVKPLNLGELVDILKKYLGSKSASVGDLHSEGVFKR